MISKNSIFKAVLSICCLLFASHSNSADLYCFNRPYAEMSNTNASQSYLTVDEEQIYETMLSSAQAYGPLDQYLSGNIVTPPVSGVGFYIYSTSIIPEQWTLDAQMTVFWTLDNGDYVHFTDECAVTGLVFM